MNNKKDIHISELSHEEITNTMLDTFNRYQVVEKVWRIENDKRVIKNIRFTEQWDDSEKLSVIQELKENGAVFGAFDNRELIGFASLGNNFLGKNNEYIQLMQLHVSYDHRGKGIGKLLFACCVEKAKEIGAKKLYISGHSSVETQSFYEKMGCVDAQWFYREQVELEPYDCQLEYMVAKSELF